MHRSLRCRYTLLTGGAQAKAALSAEIKVYKAELHSNRVAELSKLNSKPKYGDPLANPSPEVGFTFWPAHKVQLPVMYFLATVLLTAKLASARAERKNSVAGLINTPLRRHMAPAMFEMLVLEHEFTTLILKTAMDSENQARYMDVSVYEAELENDSDIELASEADDDSSSDEV